MAARTPRTYHCKACNIILPSGSAFDRHNDEKRAEGVAGHAYCEFCGMWCDNEKILAFHCREKHAVSQDLICPACSGGPFPQVSDYMRHIERRDCHIDVDMLNKMREEKLTFTRKLARIQGYKDSKDFSEFLCNDPTVVFPTKPVPKSTWWNSDATIKPGSEEVTKFPWEETSSKQKQRRQQIARVMDRGDGQGEDAGFIAPGKDLQAGATTDECWNPVTRRYNCPNKLCLKSFPSPRGLVSHIRSAHNSTRYRCPGCLKVYKSLEALASHTTATVSTYCKFRHHDGFDAFIDQLTAGLIEVERHVRSGDGTRRYRITDVAWKKFGTQPVMGLAVDTNKSSASSRARSGQSKSRRGGNSNAWVQWEDDDDRPDGELAQHLLEPKPQEATKTAKPRDVSTSSSWDGKKSGKEKRTQKGKGNGWTGREVDEEVVDEWGELVSDNVEEVIVKPTDVVYDIFDWGSNVYEWW